MILDYKNLLPSDLAHLDKTRTVFIFPVGGFEEAGPHLPVGTSALKAEIYSKKLAEKISNELGFCAVLFPNLPLNVDTVTVGFGSISTRAYVLRDWLVDACDSLSKSGFCHFVCVSGSLNPKHLTAIEDASKIVSRKVPFFKKQKGAKSTLVSASATWVSSTEAKRSWLVAAPAQHGGEQDTSFALAWYPNQVLTHVNSLGVKLPPAKNALSWLWKRWSRQIEGYWGNPSRANPQSGELALEQNLDALMPKLKAVWEGGSPDGIFRTWYSILPWNNSFFRVWIFALASVVLFSVAVILQVQDLIRITE